MRIENNRLHMYIVHGRLAEVRLRESASRLDDLK